MIRNTKNISIRNAAPKVLQFFMENIKSVSSTLPETSRKNKPQSKPQKPKQYYKPNPNNAHQQSNDKEHKHKIKTSS